MKDYVYDGSFEGLLTAIYEAYYRKEIPNRLVSQDTYQISLISQRILIETDEEKAQKVFHSIETKISKEALKKILYVYFSDLEERGTYIYHYLKLGWKIGQEVDQYLGNDSVLRIHQIYQRVNKERHFMLGLIRFRELQNNILYAPVEPQYNILGLVAPHFVNRMPQENWMIHDLRRSIGAMYNKKEWVIGEVNIGGEVPLGEEECRYQKLWKSYFKHISIENKRNIKLQKSNMPMKYWKHLIEMSVDL
ncbi:MAG: DNA metabolism protein [Epulopiscium sp.]|nr:DNA metabolism protein [Candidatus Epulonipiscium sp.]